jgi:hypothetical protein
MQRNLLQNRTGPGSWIRLIVGLPTNPTLPSSSDKVNLIFDLARSLGVSAKFPISGGR